ncbi:TPA: hypothetical protein ACSK4F_002656 [Listeria monocytogenes]
MMVFALFYQGGIREIHLSEKCAQKAKARRIVPLGADEKDYYIKPVPLIDSFVDCKEYEPRDIQTMSLDELVEHGKKLQCDLRSLNEAIRRVNSLLVTRGIQLVDKKGVENE